MSAMYRGYLLGFTSSPLAYLLFHPGRSQTPADMLTAVAAGVTVWAVFEAGLYLSRHVRVRWITGRGRVP